MKTSTALAVALLAAAFPGVLLDTLAGGPAAAEDRTASLSEPAVSGPAGGPAHAPTPQETAPQPAPFTAPSTYFSALELDHIRAAVRGQIAALAEDDADRAFAYLAPAAQSYYADAPAFLRALKAHLAPVLTAQHFALAGTERDSTDAVQLVVLTGARGEEWIARFTVERQPDGAWAIKRCLVEAASAEPRV